MLFPFLSFSSNLIASSKSTVLCLGRGLGFGFGGALNGCDRHVLGGGEIGLADSPRALVVPTEDMRSSWLCPIAQLTFADT